LLLCGARSMTCTPCRKPPIIALTDIRERNSRGLCLLFQRFRLRKLPLPRLRIPRFPRLHTLICLKGVIGRRIEPTLLSTTCNLAPPPGGLSLGKPPVIFLRSVLHSNTTIEWLIRRERSVADVVAYWGGIVQRPRTRPCLHAGVEGSPSASRAWRL
jgi:hypothetical protein